MTPSSTQSELNIVPAEEIRALVDAVRLGAIAFGRPDLAESLARTVARIERSETVVAVIGEFEQGKSSLVNALLGVELAPVDDDIATRRMSAFAFGESPSLTFVPGDGSAPVPLAGEAFRRLVTQDAAGNLGDGILKVRLPAPALQSGLCLVDTAGAGGLVPGTAGIPDGFLSVVDACIFVSDATAPLSGPELQFLLRAAVHCPAIVLALTKIDLAPEWRRIAEMNEVVLSEAGLDIPVLPVSCVLAAEADTDSDLRTLSGVPDLVELLDQIAGGLARREAARDGLEQAGDVLALIRVGLQAERSVLESPESAALLRVTLEEQRARLEHLRGPGARWAQVLSDRFADLVGDAEHRFRNSMRDATRGAEFEIESLDPGAKWDEILGTLRAATASASDRLLEDISDGATRTEAAIRDILRDEAGVFGRDAVSGLRLDLPRSPQTKGVERPGIRAQAGTLLSGLRGAQGGILMLTLFAGLTGVGVSMLAIAGAGIALGAFHVRDDRRRQVQARRQQARTAARQFTEEVQFEALKRGRDLSRELQRQLRDGFLDRFAELQQTCVRSLAAVQQGIEQDATLRTRRIQRLDDALARLDELDAGLAAAGARL